MRGFTFRPVDPGADAPLLQSWLAHPASAGWRMADLDVDGVARRFRTAAADPAQRALVGLCDGRPAFLVEHHEPTHGELAEAYDVEFGDVVLQVLVPPHPEPVLGFARAATTAALTFLLADPRTHRVVVASPDGLTFHTRPFGLTVPAGVPARGAT